MITRLRSIEPLSLLSFGVVAGGAILLLGLAGEIKEGEAPGFDRSVLLSLRNPQDLSQPVGPSWLHHAVGDLTSLGGVTVLSLLTLLVTVYFLIVRRYGLAAFVFLSILTGWLASTVLKLVVARPRPDIVPHLVDVGDLSFPSGHAMVSAVTYLTLGALLAKAQTSRAASVFLLATGVFLTILIGLTRIYLGVHYPTDVLAGWCAGSIWALGCWMLSSLFAGRGTAGAHR